MLGPIRRTSGENRSADLIVTAGSTPAAKAEETLLGMKPGVPVCPQPR